MSSKQFLMGYDMKKSKYGAKKVYYDGITFDSKKEMDRYAELKLLLKVGKISNLELQKKFVLIPPQNIDGKVAERECSYVADFVYTDCDTGKIVVEDVKGYKTPEYILKRKMMLHFYGMQIKEV